MPIRLFLHLGCFQFPQHFSTMVPFFSVNLQAGSGERLEWQLITRLQKSVLNGCLERRPLWGTSPPQTPNPDLSRLYPQILRNFPTWSWRTYSGAGNYAIKENYGEAEYSGRQWDLDLICGIWPLGGVKWQDIATGWQNSQSFALSSLALLQTFMRYILSESKVFLVCFSRKAAADSPSVKICAMKSSQEASELWLPQPLKLKMSCIWWSGWSPWKLMPKGLFIIFTAPDHNIASFLGVN